MPLYEFQCQACGRIEEHYSDGVVPEGTIAACDCGGAMVRLFPKARINLRGAGKSAVAILGKQKPRDDEGEIMQHLRKVEKDYAEAGRPLG